MNINAFLDSFQRTCSRNKYLVYLAVKIRNQANKIIAYSLAKSHLSNINGEEKLLKIITNEFKTILDVGANKGEWTKMVRKYTPIDANFYLIEPSNSAYNILVEDFGSESNIHLYNIGLSDNNEELDFFEEENAGEQSSFMITIYHKNFIKKKIEAQTLDLFCKINGITEIDFLKIDCEGYDYKVLLGAKELLGTDKIKCIQFEYGSSWSTAGATSKSAIAYLNKFGFKVWVITEKGLKNFDSDYFGEYFQYTNFFASKFDVID